MFLYIFNICKYHFLCTIFLEEDVTIQDLETLKKVELDELIKKYGQRRRFGRILVQWMLKRSLSIDPELLTVYTFSPFLFYFLVYFLYYFILFTVYFLFTGKDLFIFITHILETSLNDMIKKQNKNIFKNHFPFKS